MDLTSPAQMEKFMDRVREQETPFVDSAADAFRQLFMGEYKRLRASQLESGDGTVTLNVAVRCNFDANTVEIITQPSPVQPRPRRKAVAVPKTSEC